MEVKDSKETIKKAIQDAIILAEDNIESEYEKYLNSKSDNYVEKLSDINARVNWENEPELLELYEECYRNNDGEVVPTDIVYDMDGAEWIGLNEPTNKDAKQNFENWISKHKEYEGIELEDIAIILYARAYENKDTNRRYYQEDDAKRTARKRAERNGTNFEEEYNDEMKGVRPLSNFERILSDIIYSVNRGKNALIINEEINKALKDCKEKIAEEINTTPDKIDLSEKDFREILGDGNHQNNSIKDILLGISSLKIEFGVIQDSGMTKEEFNRIVSDIKKLNEEIEGNKRISKRDEYLKAIKSVYKKALEEYAKSAPEAEMNEAFFEKLYEIEYQGKFSSYEIKARFYEYCRGQNKETEGQSSNATPTNMKESDSKEGMEESPVNAHSAEPHNVAPYKTVAEKVHNDGSENTHTPTESTEGKSDNNGEESKIITEQAKVIAEQRKKIKQLEADKKSLQTQNEEQSQIISELENNNNSFQKQNQDQKVEILALYERTSFLEEQIKIQRQQMEKAIKVAMKSIKSKISRIAENVAQSLKPKGLLGKLKSIFTRKQDNDIAEQMEGLKNVGLNEENIVNNSFELDNVGSTKEFVEEYKMKHRGDYGNRRIQVTYGDPTQDQK